MSVPSGTIDLKFSRLELEMRTHHELCRPVIFSSVPCIAILGLHGHARTIIHPFFPP